LRPIPIDTDLIDALPFEAQRRTFAPPDYDLTGPIRGVDALIYLADIGDETIVEHIATIWQLEADDLERLQSGAAILVAFQGGAMPPHSVEVLG
jgi:hypothetical protein